jgi:C4-dicarboxylate-binding protein DctP
MQALLRTLVILAGFALGSVAYAEESIVIKFSHVVAPDTPKGQAALKFKELAEARTKGKVKVEVYPNSSLYKDKEEIEALQLGAVQMLAPAVSKFGPLGVREFEVFDLPYLFDSEEQLEKVTDGPVGQGLLKKLEAKGIKGLAYWNSGFREFCANKPLHLPDDAKGLKMRIVSSKAADAEMRAIGAIPQVMPFSELYQALQTGVVDGTDPTASNFYTQKLNEVQKYFALTNHSVLLYAVIVNKKFWDGLPADIRTQLEGAMKDATKAADELAKKDNDSALEAVRKAGKTQIIMLTPEQKRAWKKAMLKVHSEYGEKAIGKDLIQAIYKETGFDPSKL